MQMGSTGQERPADSIDMAYQAGKKATGTNEKGHAGSGKDTAATESGKSRRTSPKTGVRKKWLSEIAKKAASAPWKRGD